MTQWLRLDVRTLLKGRRLWCDWSGVCSWSDGSALRYRVRRDLSVGRLTLIYAVTGITRRQTLPLEYMAGNWWARCASCSRRVVVLWGPTFACRRCHGATYPTWQASKRERAWLASRRLALRLRDADAHGYAPPKPRWMRWPTYQRLVRQLQAANQQEALHQAAEVRGLAMAWLAERSSDYAPERPNEARQRRRAERALRAG